MTKALPDKPEQATTPADVRRIFDSQVAQRWTIAATTAKERVARLRHLREVTRRRRDEICEAVRLDFGKHPIETEVTELLPTIEEMTQAIRHLRRWMRPRRVRTPSMLARAKSEIRYEPKGVVLVLAPWNYPFLLA